MTTAAQVQAGYAAANRGQTLDTATATSIAAQIDASGGTFTLNNYITQQFEANQNSTGLALEIFQAIVGKTEATATDLTTITNTVKSFLSTYSSQGQTAVQLPQDAADDLGAQLADNATGANFRASNNLAGLYGPSPSATTATFDVNGFVSNWLTNVFGASAVTGVAVNFEAARFLELANRYKGFADANDTTGYVRAAGALVGELINQGEQANNGNYHNAAVNFIIQDATGSAPYGGNLLSGGGTGSGGGGASTGIAGNVSVLTTGADVFPTSTLPNTNDDYVNGWNTVDSLNNTDNINAGPGLDILAAKLSGAAATIQPSVQNTELQFFQVTAAAGQTIDTTLDIGAQQIWNENSVAASTLVLTNLASTGGVVTPVIGLEGGAASTITYAFLAGGVTGATLNVALDNAQGYLVTSGSVKTENISLQLETGNSLIGNTESAFGIVPAAGTNTNTITVADIGAPATLANIVVKGAGALTLIEHPTVYATLNSVDASALGALAVSKGLTFNETASTASSMTVLGSNSADTLTFKTGQIQTVQGNGGADLITLGGAATDKATVVYKLATDSNGLGADTLNTYYAGGAADHIDVKAFNFTGANAITAIATTTGTNPGSDTASLFTTAGSQAVYDTAANILYLDVNHDGSYSASSDLAIKFTGLANGPLKVADLILS